jgi:hypothetical protein
VHEPGRSQTRAELPPAAARPLEVYVNGVAQEEGRDFRVDGRTLVFARELKQEGRLGFWRWASLLAGVAGTYRQNDVVDVVYESGGRRHVASGLRLEPVVTAASRRASSSVS